MTYADYEFYYSEYFGNAITAEDFPRLAQKSSRYLDYITQGKAARNSQLEALKVACCALAEQYQTIEGLQRMEAQSIAASVESGGNELQSETVGPWSRTYKSRGESAVTAAEMMAAENSQLAVIAQQHLAHTGLLYRGGRCGRCFHTL